MGRFLKLFAHSRAFAALGLLCVAGAAPLGPAAAATPPLLWQKVARVQLLCLVRTPAGVETGRLHERICGRAARFAAEGAPAPVSQVRLGDPLVLDADAVTILVHANVESGRSGPLLALSLRPFRASAEAGSLLFAAAPRAVPLADEAALDAALRGALAETLPWLGRPAGPRSIR